MPSVSFRPRAAAVRAAAVVLSLALVTPLAAEERSVDRLITVSASGFVAAEPDRARLSTGVTAEAETASEALAANSKMMKDVVEGLKEAGIDPKDIQTSNIGVEPRYTQPRDGTPSVIDGYRVSNQVDVLVRDLGKIGSLLDKLVSLGANRVNGLAFEASKAETLKDEARKEAVANALRRARLLAEAAGAEVGDVVSIAEDTGYAGPPRPMTMARAAPAASVPIEAGTEMLEARVTVTWKLK